MDDSSYDIKLPRGLRENVQAEHRLLCRARKRVLPQGGSLNGPLGRAQSWGCTFRITDHSSYHPLAPFQSMGNPKRSKPKVEGTLDPRREVASPRPSCLLPLFTGESACQDVDTGCPNRRDTNAKPKMRVSSPVIQWMGIYQWRGVLLT